MVNITAFAIALCFVLSIVGGAPAIAAETFPAAEKLAADTPRATAAGTTFSAPAGWTIATTGNMVLLDPPETDSHLAIVDVQAADADAAIAAGWAVYRPDSKRPLKLATPQAPRNGWEERRLYQYETSPNERAVVYAMAWRAGTAWTVIIIDASEPTFEKRGGPISLVVQSVRPSGYQRESFAGRKAHPLDAEHIATMKAFVESGMRQLGIPGVGLSLIDRGRVVFQGGLGVKELGKTANVDADTLFMAASNTKALTTLLIAELVDAKKLRWDEPVIEAYPAFKLGDDDTTRQVLIKHLICACTGMPRQDLEWLFEFHRATPSSSMTLLGTMQPTSKFGEVFQYSNLMATAAGYVGASIAAPHRELGGAYDAAMRGKIFLPLGMKNTTFDFARAQKGNYARPHADDVDGRPSRASMDPNYSVVPIRPAGGVWTSARDLGRYVQMELARGKLAGGKRLVSEENLLARHAPQVLVSEDVTYGMGLFVDKRWGVPVVHHGGSMFGYKSDMIWLPDHAIGAVVLTNSDTGQYLLAPFLRRLLEVVFAGKPEAEDQLRAAAVQKNAEIAKTRERLVIPADPVEAGKLARRYACKELGDLNVRQQAGQIVFDVGEWHSTVASRKNDDGTVSFFTIDPGFDGIEFVVAEREGKRVLIIRDAQHEYAFVEA